MALFATCLADYNFPHIAASAVRVLEKNGWNVVRPEQTCCGMPNLDGGDIDAAAAKARVNVASLALEIDRGHTVVSLQPTCGYMVRKEWPELLGTNEARKVAAATVDVMELLEQQRRDEDALAGLQEGPGAASRTTRPATSGRRRSATRRRACSSALPETEVEVVEQCSAVDGTWGMKAQHYEMGRRYAQKLTRGIERVEPRIVVTDCALSARRILAENGLAPLHPVEALAEAYGLSPSTRGTMKPIDRGEILGLADYEAIRERFRGAGHRREEDPAGRRGPPRERRLREPRHGAPSDPGDAPHRANHATCRRSSTRSTPTTSRSPATTSCRSR